jgi:hypothetical protein
MVLGYAISGTVIHWAPYQSWALWAWSHFRYGALPVPVWGSASSGTVILKDESQKREASGMNLKKQENCELRFIYLSEQS